MHCGRPCATCRPGWESSAEIQRTHRASGCARLQFAGVGFGSAVRVRGPWMQPFSRGLMLAGSCPLRMTAVAELRFLDMIGERSLPEWTGRSTEKLPPTPLGRLRPHAQRTWPTGMHDAAVIEVRMPGTCRQPVARIHPSAFAGRPGAVLSGITAKRSLEAWGSRGAGEPSGQGRNAPVLIAATRLRVFHSSVCWVAKRSKIRRDDCKNPAVQHRMRRPGSGASSGSRIQQ
jgi:hypothetical protein